MTAPVSHRVVEQRLRNRIMEALELRAMGDACVQDLGSVEFFEGFYDLIPHRDHGAPFPNGAINPAEFAALAEVSRMMDDACDATPRLISEAGLIASGWPDRIRPVAAKALHLMQARGRFSEDIEQTTPNAED